MYMESWYLINGQPTFNGGTETEDFYKYVNDGFEELLETPLASDVLFCSGQYDPETETFEVEVESKAIIQNKTFDAYTQGFKRQILTRITDKIAQYKYIKSKDTMGNWQIYLIMTMPDTNEIYEKVVAHECNYVLRWQDRKTGVIYNYPCLIEDASQYNSGVETVNSILQTPYNQYMCWLSFDDISISLRRDMRMFIDYSSDIPETYIITSTSKVSYSYNERRIIRITFTETEYNPDTDRVDLMICDYIDPNDKPEPTTPIVITYNGNPEIKIGGRKTFKVDSADTIVFSLLVDSRWTDKITIEQSNNQCVVRCANDTNMVGTNFKLIATCNGEQSELLITIKGAF